MGHLTRDPALKYLPNQTPVAEFGLATNRKWKDASGQEREDVLFVDCAAFGKPAELIDQYLTKGKPLFVEGRLKLDTWEDKNGGGKRSKISIVVENFQFIGGKDSADTANESASPPTTKSAADYPRNMRPEKGQPPTEQEALGEGQHFKPDDIPF